MKADFQRRFGQAHDIVYMEKPEICGTQSFVTTSRVKALTQMIASARAKGFRKIGFLLASRIWQTEQMLWDEFHAAMTANGLEVNYDYIFEYQRRPEDTYEIKYEIDEAIEKMILPNRPEFLYVDDGNHAAVLLDRLGRHGIHIALCGGDANPLFSALGIPTFDPCYDKIADGLIAKILDPSIRYEPLTIEAIAGDKNNEQ
jgi:DNA-binding LacI/PurR family transcriptional regulator